MGIFGVKMTDEQFKNINIRRQNLILKKVRNGFLNGKDSLILEKLQSIVSQYIDDKYHVKNELAKTCFELKRTLQELYPKGLLYTETKTK